jgi:hypothetical protein
LVIVSSIQETSLLDHSIFYYCALYLYKMSSANNTTTPQASSEPNTAPPSDTTTPVTQEAAAAAASSSPASDTTNAVTMTMGGPLTTMTAPTTALSASISATAADGTAIATATGGMIGVGSIQTPATAPPVGTTTSTTTLAQSAQQPQTASSAQSNSTTAGTGTGTGTTTTNISGKKRPYRRTKRPTNYCDKSTITTVSGNSTSATFALSVNVYDAVLAESRDLLTAATEAQQLGRLKMAAAYQLLLHARLVGLGKRFDKAIVQTTNTSSGVATNDAVDHTNMNMDTTVEEDDAAAVTTPGPQLQPSTPATPAAATAAEASTTSTTQAENPDSSSQVHVPPRLLQPPPTPTTAAARQLAKLLPPTCELDQTMMEHLAKAAAELHAQRSGRKRQLAVAVAAVDPELIQTPDQFFAQTANQLQLPNAANSNPGIAWSAADVKQLTAAQESNKSVKEIATLVNKSEQQVKAYLRNLLARNKVEADLDELPLDANGTNTGPDQASAKKRGGGRGRKPATTAISTVPNAVCDARTLLQGKGIPKLTK